MQHTQERQRENTPKRLYSKICSISIYVCVQWTLFIQVLLGLTEVLTVLQCSLKSSALTPKIYSLWNIFSNGLPVSALNRPSFVLVCVSVLGLGLTDRSQPIRSSASSADAADVELVCQHQCYPIYVGYLAVLFLWNPFLFKLHTHITWYLFICFMHSKMCYETLEDFYLSISIH